MALISKSVDSLTAIIIKIAGTPKASGKQLA